MPEITEPTELLTEDAVAEIEARLARCLDNKNQSRLTEASILIAEDIPTLIRDWKAMRAENELLRWDKHAGQDLIDAARSGRELILENAALRKQLNALRQQVEDTILVAKTDEDANGFISAYHFQTGAIHRLLAEARQGG